MRRGCRSCSGGPLYGSNLRLHDGGSVRVQRRRGSLAPSERTAAMLDLPRDVLVTLEATIGAGKSTQLRLLKEARTTTAWCSLTNPTPNGKNMV